MRLLDGKAVVVTGAGSGLGRSYALAASSAGASLVLNDRDEKALAEIVAEVAASGGAVQGVAGSISDWRVANRLTRFCVGQFGAIDGVVNNAAVFHSASPQDETAATLRRIVETNVIGNAFVAINAFAAMRKQGYGRIINVVSGAQVGIKGMTAYGTTKGAAAALTYNLALEAVGTGITVNAISPVALTDMSATAESRADGITRPSPDAIAVAILYLLSDLAEHLNGQIVRFDSHSLSIVVPPRLGEVQVSEHIDTPEGIAAAFDSILRRELRPIGLFNQASALTSG